MWRKHRGEIIVAKALWPKRGGQQFVVSAERLAGRKQNRTRMGA
jgi:hypothetical protein